MGVTLGDIDSERDRNMAAAKKSWSVADTGFLLENFKDLRIVEHRGDSRMSILPT